jgi:actin-related protein
MQWQLRAKEADLVENWARAQHRKDDAGFVEVETTTVFEHVSRGDDSKIMKGRKSVVSLRGVAPKREGQAAGKSMLEDDEKQLRVEGDFLVDQYGNIDFKAGDELVDLTRYDNVKEWDPTPVLVQLYDNRKPEKLTRGAGADDDELVMSFGKGEVRIEGYLDKLPKGKTKASVLTRYNRRYFKARDGELFYYEDDKSDRASGFIRLRGSEIRFKGGNLLEVFDPRKKASMVIKTSSTTELEDWKMALDEEATTLRRRIVRDERTANELRNTLIFDIGSCSARAGFAEPSGVAWPSVYMPSCVGVPKAEDGEYSFGTDALLPQTRAHCNIRYPLRSATNFSDHMDADLMDAMYGNLFQRLEVDSSERTVIVTEPQYASDRDRARLAEIMFETYNVPALYMKSQSLLSMYSYNATTGIIVDIGDRLDIIPLDSGYVIEKGVTKMRIGGGYVSESLTRMMSEAGHRFFSPVEHYVGRYVKERLAYVANDYSEALRFEEMGKIDTGHVDVRRFAVPDQTKTFSLAGQRFRCTEGLFQPTLWGKDTPGLHELVHKAIMATAMDMRKTMSRNIYLAGGGTMIPGLAERLEEELRFLLPTSSTVKVHGAPHRQHAAIQGASVLASLPNFASLCVWNEDWQEGGPDVLRKWKEETLAPDMDYSDDDDDDDMIVRGDRGDRGAPSGATGSQRVFVDGGEDDNDDEDDSGDEEAETGGAQGPTDEQQEEDEESEDDEEPDDPDVGEEYI